jgi:glycosyltransferase involved in cell wall biosynthesis
MENKSLKTSLSVIIPALNEEKNIELLLNDILSQLTHPVVKNGLQKIIVISDASTDSTDSVVERLQNTNPLIDFVRNNQRLGKISTLGKAFRMAESDYVLLLDGDVRFESNTLINIFSRINSSDADMIGGNPIPVQPISLFNIAQLASMFSWYLLQSIKEQNPDSIYSSHGRVMILNRSIYKSVDVSECTTSGDDQFFYIKSKSFKYDKNIKVLYKLPGSTRDYLNQNVRFRFAKATKDNMLKVESKSGAFEVNNKFKILLVNLLKHPLCFISWSTLYTIGYVKYLIKPPNKKTASIWTGAKSTK